VVPPLYSNTLLNIKSYWNKAKPEADLKLSTGNTMNINVDSRIFNVTYVHFACSTGNILMRGTTKHQAATYARK
jgi:hypothetical protein